MTCRARSGASSADLQSSVLPEELVDKVESVVQPVSKCSLWSSLNWLCSDLSRRSWKPCCPFTFISPAGLGAGAHFVLHLHAAKAVREGKSHLCLCLTSSSAFGCLLITTLLQSLQSLLGEEAEINLVNYLCKALYSPWSRQTSFKFLLLIVWSSWCLQIWHLTSLVWHFQTRERPCPRNLHQTHSVELTLSQKFAEILVASHLKRLSRLIPGKFRRF